MLLSILIPVYNVEPYLNRCINSLISMPMEDYEIILVNDGSTDNSGKICNELQKKYNKIKVIHQSNQGLVSARNAALRIARGEYITFVDSDDWVDAELLPGLVEDLKKNSDTDIAIGKTVKNTNDTNDIIFWSRKSEILSKEECIKSMVNKNGFHWTLWGKVYRKKLFNGLIVDTRVTIYEDLDRLWPVLKRANKFIFNDNFAYHYFLNTKSMTEKRCDLNIYSWRVFQRILLDDYNIKSIKQEIANFYLQIFFHHTLEMYFRDFKEYRSEIEKYIHELKNTFSNAIVAPNIIPDEDYKKITFSYESLIDFYNNFLSKLKNLLITLKDKNQIYVYGTGIIAQYVMAIMQDINIFPIGFVVSDGQAKKDVFMNQSVYYLSEVQTDVKAMFVLALSGKSEKAVLKSFEQNKFIDESQIFMLNFPPIVI